MCSVFTHCESAQFPMYEREQEHITMNFCRVSKPCLFSINLMAAQTNQSKYAM